MNRAFIAFFPLLLFGNLYSQTDTSAARFFPAAIGNAWHYRDQPIETLTRDSLGDARFLFYNGDSIPAYSVDTALNVVQFPTQPRRRMLRYRLNAPPLQWWVVQERDTTIGRRALDARVDSVFWGSLFGVVTRMKAIGYYTAQRLGDSVYHYWHYEEYLAAGFGFFLSFTDPPWTPYQELVGCIIDGRRYGTLVSAPEEDMRIVPLSSRLYPCFPNPFNPSTTISYFLSESGRVKVSVYDILGRKVVALLDEHRNNGFHSVFFQPDNLPSGVYFVRLTVRTFTATTKIIYSK